jgi:hypothetical protein
MGNVGVAGMDEASDGALTMLPAAGRLASSSGVGSARARAIYREAI